MKLTYQVVIVKEGEKYWGYIPDIPGVYGIGSSPEEAKDDLERALLLYIEDCLEDGENPPFSKIENISVDKISLSIDR